MTPAWATARFLIRHIPGTRKTSTWAAGNLLNDGYHQYSYDAENRLASVDAGATTYAYDAAGRRVRKAQGSSITDYLYDPQGRQVAAVSSTGNWIRMEIYAGSRHLGTYASSTTYFSHTDWLGTERARTVVTSATPAETCKSNPWGDEQNCTGAQPTPLFFTGKERDAERGLDNFGARYYGSSLGRFMRPDPIMIMKQRFTDPQQWNMYSYARNNSLRFVDPSGKYTTCALVLLSCVEQVSKFETARQQDLQSKDERVRGAAAAYGDLGEANGVKVQFDPNATLGTTSQDRDASHKPLSSVTVTLPTAQAGNKGLIAHEGSHVEDFNSIMHGGAQLTHYQGEMKAYQTQMAVMNDDYPIGVIPASWTFHDQGASMTLMQPVDKTAEAVNAGAIQEFLATAPDYGFTEQSQGGAEFVHP